MKSSFVPGRSTHKELDNSFSNQMMHNKERKKFSKIKSIINQSNYKSETETTQQTHYKDIKFKDSSVTQLISNESRTEEPTMIKPISPDPEEISISNRDSHETTLLLRLFDNIK